MGCNRSLILLVMFFFEGKMISSCGLAWVCRIRMSIPTKSTTSGTPRKPPLGIISWGEDLAIARPTFLLFASWSSSSSGTQVLQYFCRKCTRRTPGYTWWQHRIYYCFWLEAGSVGGQSPNYFLPRILVVV